MAKGCFTISVAVIVNIVGWGVMIAAIVVGAKNLGNCPVQRGIPIYLITLSTVNLLVLVLGYFECIDGEGWIAILRSGCKIILNIFNFCMLISGSIWVYTTYPPSYTPKTPRFCDKTTYLFAFSLTTVIWSLSALVLIGSACFFCIAYCGTLIDGRILTSRGNRTYGSTEAPQETAGSV